MNIESLQNRINEILKQNDLYDDDDVESIPRPNKLACENCIKFIKLLQLFKIEIVEDDLVACIDGGISIIMFDKEYEYSVDFINDGNFIISGYDPDNRSEIIIESLKFIEGY